MLIHLYGPIFAMLLTTIVSWWLILMYNRAQERLERVEGKEKDLHANIEQVKTLVYSIQHTLDGLKVKHYENLAVEVAELTHNTKTLEGKLDSQVEVQRRFEAKITQRLRRSAEAEPKEAVVDNAFPFVPGDPAVEQPSQRKRKFGTFGR